MMKLKFKNVTGSFLFWGWGRKCKFSRSNVKF